MICGSIGLLLSNGGQSDGWIPINTNLASLSFILAVAGLAFIILTILYLLIDVKHWFTGAPFIWLGMNSLVVYVGHMLLETRFPIGFGVHETHATLMAINMYSVLVWTVISGIMYWNRFFIAI